MLINSESIRTEADNFKATIVADSIVAAFGSHKISFSDFSNDYSNISGNAGSIIRVPLIGKTGGAKTANADGTDDFSIGSKTVAHKDIELALKYVTAPLTIGEMETGASFADFVQALANDVVEEVQKTLETKLIEGVTAGSVTKITVGEADDFTAATLTKKVRPAVRKAGVAEPVAYIESGYYASVIPMDKDGFDPSKPHFGFTKVAEYSSYTDGVVGIAASPNALAVATRIPQSIMANPAYTTKFAYQIPEIGVNVLYCEWANPNNGTQTAGLFWLQGMELAADKAAAVLYTA